MALDDLKLVLKKDSRYLRYKSIGRTIEQTLPYETLCAEIDMIQTARKVRTATLGDLQPRELLDVSMDEVSHRARLTEILVQAKRKRHDLAAIVDGVWGYIAAEYADELSTFRTKDDRSQAISSCMGKGYELLSSLDSLIDQCETTIKDIDQTGFALSRIANLFELVLRRENLVNVGI